MKNVILIFLTALILRLAFLCIWYIDGKGSHLPSDITSYYQIAESLKEGKGFQIAGKPSTRRPPFYPIWIVSFLRTSSFPLGLQIGDALIGAISCVFLYGIGKELFGEKVGILGALFLAVDYLSVRQTASALSETLFVLFMLVSFYFLFVGHKRYRSANYFWAGVFGGFCLLTRDALIYFYPFIAVWIMFSNASIKVRLLWITFFFLGLTFTTGPWIVRNSLLHNQPVLITTMGGHNFYLANNSRATGGTTGGEWEFNRDLFYPDDLPYELSSLKADKYLFKKGIEFVRENPKQFIRLMKIKIINTWRPFQKDIPFYSKLLTTITYLPVFMGGFLGMMLTFNRWRDLSPVYGLIAYTFLQTSVLLGQIRYRLPVMPFFMIFAAYAFFLSMDKIMYGLRKGRICISWNCQ